MTPRLSNEEIEDLIEKEAANGFSVYPSGDGYYEYEKKIVKLSRSILEELLELRKENAELQTRFNLLMELYESKVVRGFST